MTKKAMTANVISIFLFLIIVLGFGLFFKLNKFDDMYQFIKDFSGLLISACVLYIGFCFQKRQNFVSALRSVWTDVVKSKCQIVEYTYIDSPDIKSYHQAHASLSLAIDLVRGVYRNVGETDREVGYYPYEPLHDMRKALEELGWENVDGQKQDRAREKIQRAWNSLRRPFLKEFSMPEPAFPIVERHSSDPRRI
ncbi:hypothetical protein [Azorhizobium caulinodans]|uniref:hypothetical protein n=1 Tax=Azorhizobium caulinodans TaxID=7 RepID=UPI002FBE2AB3